MDMPVLVPIPIKTKSESIFVRIWRWITAIRKWEVNEDWEYTLADGPTIVVPKTFIFDGASIPKPLWALLSPTGLLLIPGLIHDFAYRYDFLWALDLEGYAYKYKAGAGRSYWDALFRRVGLDVNGVAIIDTLAWAALSIGGWWSWSVHRKRVEPAIRPSRPLKSERDQSTSTAE